MNVFWFEIKQSYRQALIWLVSVCFTLGLFGSMYPTYLENEKTMTTVLGSYPPAMLDALGINLKTIFSFNGFYSFCLNYLLLVMTIMSLYFAISTFGREKKTKTSDFLFTTPMSRGKIFLNKFLASFGLLVIINACYLIFSVVIFNTIGKGYGSFDAYILITVSLFIVEFIFYSFGIMVTTIIKKIKNIGGLANSIGFIFFILSMLSSIIDEKWLIYVTPFKYFNPSYIIDKGYLELSYLLLSVFLISLFMGVSYVKFTKQDLDNI